VAFVFGIRSGYGLYSYVFSMVPGLFATCIVFPILTKRLKIAPSASRGNVSWLEIRRIFALGFDLFWVALYNLILGHTLLLYGGILLSASDIAILTVNLKFVQFGLQVAQRIPGTAEPVLAQMVTLQDFARFRPNWLLAAKVALGCTILGTGILYLWAGFAVGHWTSPADQMSQWPLLMVCLLPLRYITHTVCVLACTLFKAANELRFALAWELVLYTALAFPLGRAFGVGGLLAASMLSLLGGSLIPGLRLVRRLGQFPPGLVPRAIARTLLPGFVVLFVVAALVPHPESIELFQRYILTLSWTGAALGLIWFAGFDGSERAAIREKSALIRRPA
jgi:O-antigen/teichoic acid export membrane protein